MSITDKGLLFSLDLMIAFLIMLLILALFLVYCDNVMAQEKANVEQLQLEKKALVKLDRVLKKDAAIYNADKKRVEEQLIDLIQLQTMELQNQGIFFVIQYKVIQSFYFSCNNSYSTRHSLKYNIWKALLRSIM